MRNSRWLVTSYIIIILIGILVALPNVLSKDTLARLPSWLPHNQVSLGLDLRGGSHLVLEVDAADLTKERLQSLIQDSRRVLRDANIGNSSIRRVQDYLLVTLTDPGQRDAAITELQKLANPVGIGLTAGQSDLAVTAEGDAGVKIAMTPAGLEHNISAAVEQSLEIIRQRVDQVGVSEPTIQRVGGNRVLVQLPGAEDPSQLRKLLGSTAKMSFHLLGNAGDRGVTVLKDEEGNSYPVVDRVELSGDRLSDARVGFEPNTREPIVSFRFDNAGAVRFADITRANVGRPFAIVLDDKVLSAPVIREPITGGSGQISGNFSVASANTLAALLRAGALPAKLTVIEERRRLSRGRRHPQGRLCRPDRLRTGRRIHLHPLWRLGHSRQLRADAEHHPDLCRPDADRGDPDAAGHRRHRARHRPCGRRQRSHQRTHQGRNPKGQIHLRRHRFGLCPRLLHHRRQ